jgi:predicted RNA-binding protein
MKSRRNGKLTLENMSFLDVTMHKITLYDLLGNASIREYVGQMNIPWDVYAYKDKTLKKQKIGTYIHRKSEQQSQP